MALVTSKEMFAKAYDGGYAIGAFNVNNMEIVQGITEACQEERAPVILQVSKGARAYANHTYLVKLVEAAVATCPDIPIVLHLDHGPDFETCKSCIDGGFTSVIGCRRREPRLGYEFQLSHIHTQIAHTLQTGAEYFGEFR